MALPRLHQEFPATLCRNRSDPVTSLIPCGLEQTSLEEPELMRTLVDKAAEELEDSSAEDIIRWATDTFGDRICITSSMTDAVIVHLASGVRPGIEAVLPATAEHFPQNHGAP